LSSKSAQWKEFAPCISDDAEEYIHAVQIEIQDDRKVFRMEAAGEGRVDGG